MVLSNVNEIRVEQDAPSGRARVGKHMLHVFRLAERYAIVAQDAVRRHQVKENCGVAQFTAYSWPVISKPRPSAWVTDTGCCA